MVVWGGRYHEVVTHFGNYYLPRHWFFLSLAYFFFLVFENINRSNARIERAKELHKV